MCTLAGLFLVPIAVIQEGPLLMEMIRNGVFAVSVAPVVNFVNFVGEISYSDTHQAHTSTQKCTRNKSTKPCTRRLDTKILHSHHIFRE